MEASIAFTLVAIVTHLLMGFMRNTIFLAEEMSSIRKTVLARQKCYARLLQVFSQTERESLEIKEEALTLSFENGLDRELLFSGLVGGEISLDNDKNLILTLTKKGTAESRIEYLFPNVAHMDFEAVGERIFLVTLVDKRDKEIVFPCYIGGDSKKTPKSPSVEGS
ncbi:MAG: hypothetical protein JSR76_06375 [Verrucomicrobia bacterium]|nr:hypothetical protein [Verrucomicrobiota bacterium]